MVAEKLISKLVVMVMMEWKMILQPTVLHGWLSYATKWTDDLPD